MRWYWEPGHFRTSLGDKIIDRLYGGGADFGRDLTPATIDAVLAAIRHERDEGLAEASSPRRSFRPSAGPPALLATR